MGATTKKRVMTYMKPKLGYDVEVFKGLFAGGFVDVLDPSIRHFYISSPLARRVIQELQRLRPERKYVLHSSKGLRDILWDYQLVGFNNGDYDDYMIKGATAGKTTREIYEMSRLAIDERQDLWKLGYDSAFATFDLRSVLGNNVSLKQLASEMGLVVWEFDEVPWDYDGEWTFDLLLKLVKYLDNDLDVTVAAFQHPVILSAYQQHAAFIDRYLPGADYLISRRDASLAEKSLTKNGKLTVTKDRKFDWMLNGHNVLAEVPPAWRNEYYRYSQDLEAALPEFERLVEEGMDKVEAHNATFGQVILPQIETIWITPYFGLDPSAGGIHSTFTNHPDYKPEGSNIVRCYGAEHFDIGGAYGATARQKNVYGICQETYNLFMDDKFRFKNAYKAFKKNQHLSLDKIKAGILKNYDVKIESTSKEAAELELKGGVEASKLGTNSPTGKADSPVSNLYNPIGMIQVRLILQCLFYSILKALVDAGCVPFSANTDGFFMDARGVDVQPYITAWENKWALTLDYDHLDAYIAKDDNNRILIEDGKVVETAGDDLCHQTLNPKKLGSKPRIVDNALLKKVLNPDLSIREILEGFVAEKRVDLFAWTLKPTKNHKMVFDYKIGAKINRILITKDGVRPGHYSVTKDVVEKVKHFDDSWRATLINGEMPSELPENLDLDAYEAMVAEVYERWS